MTRTGISCRAASIVVCMATALAAPAGAMALTTHSATASTVNTAGYLVATAKCGPSEHVVSGGFNSTDQADSGGPVVSRAVKGNSWTVQFSPVDLPDTLTAYAYCAHAGQISTSKHEKKVRGKLGGANTTATARCATGQKLVSGGLAYSPVAGEDFATTFRNYAASASKWKVMSIFPSTPAKLAAFAYCARGVVVKVRSSSRSISSNGDGSATASCHKGETLLSGGYTTTPTPDWHNTTGPDFYYSGSYRSGARSWTASAHNYGKPGKLTAFADCKA